MNSKPRVLVVEDDPFTADTIGTELGELGLEVVGPACSFERAAELAKQNRLSAAVVNLGFGPSTTTALARDLVQRGCPVLLVLADGRTGPPSELDDCAWIQRPFSHEELALAIRQLLAEDDRCKQGECPCRS
jgi:DNA-binding response OmpR family regulator